MSTFEEVKEHRRSVIKGQDIESSDAKIEVYYFNCPHCDGFSMVTKNEINCKIFRHGVHNQGMMIGQPINPHASMVEVQQLLDGGLILGCGKPIQMTDDLSQVKTCGWI